MRRWIQRLGSRRAELDEAAFALPVLLLVSLGLVNLALLGFAAVNAANAAEYGARVGAVAQTNQASAAMAAANNKLSGVRVGTYTVTVTGNGTPGSRIEVRVQYRVPNYFGGLSSLFLAAPRPSSTFTGTAKATFRQEGW